MSGGGYRFTSALISRRALAPVLRGYQLPTGASAQRLMYRTQSMLLTNKNVSVQPSS